MANDDKYTDEDLQLFEDIKVKIPILMGFSV